MIFDQIENQRYWQARFTKFLLHSTEYKTEYLNETIVIESGYDRLTLNGEEYLSGTKITRIGNYKLDE